MRPACPKYRLFLFSRLPTFSGFFLHYYCYYLLFSFLSSSLPIISSSWNLCLFLYPLFFSKCYFSLLFLYLNSSSSFTRFPPFFFFPISFFSPSSSVTPSVRTLFLYILLYSVLPALLSCFCSFISCLYSKL